MLPPWSREEEHQQDAPEDTWEPSVSPTAATENLGEDSSRIDPHDASKTVPVRLQWGRRSPSQGQSCPTPPWEETEPLAAKLSPGARGHPSPDPSTPFSLPPCPAKRHSLPLLHADSQAAAY